MDEVLVHLGRRPDKAGVRQPLVEPRGGDDESKPPSAALMITTAVAAVVTGNTGFALVRCVMNAWALPEDSLLTSNTWARERLRWLAPLHALALVVLAVAGAQLWWRARAALDPSKLPAPPREHDARWDNLKFFATMAVAVAHFVSPFEEYAPVLAVRMCQEWWLMQTYVFMSGYLSAPREQTPKRLRAIWGSLVGPYVVAQYMYLALIRLGWLVVGEASEHSWYAVAKIPPSFSLFSMFWNPWCLCWYLMTLVVWRVAAPLWTQLRRPLLCASAVAVLCGYVAFPSVSYADGDFLRLKEALAYFPYYILGVHARAREAAFRAALAWPGTRAAALAAAVAMVGGVLVNVAAFADFAPGCLAARATPAHVGTLSTMAFYDDDDLDMTATFTDEYEGGAWVALAWYGPAAALPAHALLVGAAVALLGGDGRKIRHVSDAGANSIVNYVFHYVVVLALALLGFYNEYSVAKLVAAIAIAAAQSQVWMAAPVATALRSVLMPRQLPRLLLLDEEEPARVIGAAGV